MSTAEVEPERLAELFYHYHEALGAHSAGDRSQCSPACKAPAWNEVPLQEKTRLVAATRLALLELQSTASAPPKPYFAQPGAAEWGC